MENMLIPQVRMADYAYNLPDEKIAKRPKEERGKTKLLIYSNEHITHVPFENIIDELREGDFLVFNNSKVFPARMVFKKDSGAHIEVFALQPIGPSEREGAFFKQKWEVIVGNLKRWPLGTTITFIEGGVHLEVQLVEKVQDHCHVIYTWKGADDLIDLFEQVAELPLPPYLKRKADIEDYERYQTVYAQERGSVAAPTAGLHFTPQILDKIRSKGVDIAFITLHVGAGTFKPVKSSDISGHVMHTEQYMVSSDTLEKLRDAQRIIAVGTTTLRVLESLYLLAQKPLQYSHFTDQWACFNTPILFTRNEVWDRLINHADGKTLKGSTAICICPDYLIKSIDGLLTNFHQPQSTLILLVAAWLGKRWKDVYDYALTHDFLFLSYGDSSLLWKP